ncbi:MAG: CPBP family intramembrane metalloprotease [Fibrella sp.]|nr:CPBP family intramembrane metalloprotease [Armatimonadota bacterium]
MSVPASETPPPPAVLQNSSEARIRWIEWFSIYLLSFGGSLFISLSFLFRGYHPTPELTAMVAQASPERYLQKIVVAVASLSLLYCVLARRGQSLGSLGFVRFRWSDLLAGVLLAGVAYVAAIAVDVVGVLATYFLSGGRVVFPTDTQNMGWLSGESFRQSGTLSIAFLAVLRVTAMVVNPVHEEVVARAFTQTEWENGSRHSPAFAAVLSAVLQGAYHLYQGISAAVGLAVMFLCFGFFFTRQRRILPVIIAHLLFDAIALISYW